MTERIGVVSLLIQFGRQLDSMITASSIANARELVRDAERRAELQAALEVTRGGAPSEVAARA